MGARAPPTLDRPRCLRAKIQAHENEGGSKIDTLLEFLKAIDHKNKERYNIQAIKELRKHGKEYEKITDAINFMASSKHRPSAYNYRIKDFKDGTIQITHYEVPQLTGYARKHNPQRKEDRTMANEQNARRARKKVYELVKANLTPYTKFVTLTYADNMEDYDTLATHYRSFIRNLERNGYEFPYLWVVEKQKRGALHVHALFFTDEYIPHKQLAKAWKHGFVKINAQFDKVDHKAQYVAKYIQKDTLPPDKKAYRTSRNIKRPTSKVGQGDVKDELWRARLEGFERTNKDTYTIPSKDDTVNIETGEVQQSMKVATVYTYRKTDGPSQDAKRLEQYAKRKGGGNHGKSKT